MDGLEKAKDLYKACPIRIKYVSDIDSVMESMNKEIHFIGSNKHGINLIHIFDMNFDYYFSLTGFDRIKVMENSKIIQGNYNLIAKYLNRTLKDGGEAWSAVFDYINKEKDKFMDTKNEFLELKKRVVLSNYSKEIMSKLDGFGMSDRYKDTMVIAVKPKKKKK